MYLIFHLPLNVTVTMPWEFDIAQYAYTCVGFRGRIPFASL